jgi:hypothetical protein
VLYAIAALLTPDTAAAIVTACVLMVVCTMGAAIWLGAEILDHAWAAAVLVLTAGAFLTMACMVERISGGPYLVFWHLSFPGLHGGAIGAGLLSAAAALRYLRARGNAASLFAVGALAAVLYVSDRLFVIQFAIPLLLTTTIFGLLRRIPARRAVLLGAACIVGLLAGILADHALVEGGIYNRPVPGGLRELSFRGQLTLLFTVVKDTGTFLLKEAPLLLIPQLALLWAIRDIVFLRSLRGRDFRVPFLSVFVVAVLIATVIAPAVSGLWMGMYTLRYILPVFLMPPVYAAIRLLPHLRLPANAIGAAILALCVVRSAGSFRKLSAVELPYPEEVRCVDQLSAARNLQAGLSGYWPAKRIYVESRRGLQVNQLVPDLQPFQLSGNPWWFRGPKTPDGYNNYPAYDFAIVDELNQHALLSRFGEPASRHQCGPYTVWIYNRPGDAGFRNFLREESIAITEGVSGLAAREPVERVFESGNRVRFRFRKPVRTQVAELLSVEHDELDLTLLLNGRPVATVFVPRNARYAEIPGAPVRADAVILAARTPAGRIDTTLRLY